MAEEKKSSAALIAGAWLVVLIPAAWGLTYTTQNAMKLFTAPAPVAAPAATSPAAASSGVPAAASPK